MLEVVVLVFERGGRCDERSDQVFELFDFDCQYFDGVKDGIIGCDGCLGIKLLLKDGAAFTKVSEGRVGPWVAAVASCLVVSCVFPPMSLSS